MNIVGTKVSPLPSIAWVRSLGSASRTDTTPWSYSMRDESPLSIVATPDWAICRPR